MRGYWESRADVARLLDVLGMELDKMDTARRQAEASSTPA